MSARILLLMLHVVYGGAAEVFLVTPLNVTGGTVATFTCTSRVATSLFWTVNGSALDEAIIRDQGIIVNLFSPVGGVTGTRLTIPTMRATSNTIVVCGALVRNGSTITLEESSALLMLQGPPGRVTRLTGEVVNDTFHLSWTPPPTIDLTDINPDLHYNVTITKTVMNGEDVNIPCEECPLSTPQYSFTAEETGPCVAYNFSVFAFNAAGKGKEAYVNYGSISDPPQPGNLTTGVNITAELVDEDVFRCIITSRGLQLGNVCFFTINLDNGKTVEANQTVGGFSVNLVMNSLELPFDRIYTANVTACNVADSTDYDGSLIFSTYDLQRAIIQDGPGTIDITGIFVINSKAKGYFVVDINEKGNPEHFALVFDEIVMNRIFTTIGNVSKGNHRIIMFDIEANGVPGETAAYFSSVYVNNGPQPNEDYMLSASDKIVEENGLICVPCTSTTTTCTVVAYALTNKTHLIHPNELFCFNLADGDYYIVIFDNVGIYPSDVLFHSVTTSEPSKPPQTPMANGFFAATVVVPVILAIMAIVIVMITMVMYTKYSRGKMNFQPASQSNMRMRNQSENHYSVTGTNGLQFGDGEVEDETQIKPSTKSTHKDLETRDDWVCPAPPQSPQPPQPPSYEAAISAPPAAASAAASAASPSTDADTDNEPTYATATTAGTKSDPIYANANATSAKPELAYAIPELSKARSEEPFLPKDTEVQYSKVQQSTEEGTVTQRSLVGIHHETSIIPEEIHREEPHILEDVMFIAEEDSISFRNDAGLEEAHQYLKEEVDADDKSHELLASCWKLPSLKLSK